MLYLMGFCNKKEDTDSVLQSNKHNTQNKFELKYYDNYI